MNDKDLDPIVDHKKYNDGYVNHFYSERMLCKHCRDWEEDFDKKWMESWRNKTS